MHEQPAPSPTTGHPEVDRVLGSLDSLGDLPVEDHVAVFEAAQAGFRAVLDGSLD